MRAEVRRIAVERGHMRGGARLANMSVCHLVQEFSQFWSVDEVAVVSEADSVGAVDIERLSLSTCAYQARASVSNAIWSMRLKGLCSLLQGVLWWAGRTCASSRVPEVADTHEAWQIENTLAVLEDVASHAIAFTLVTVGVDQLFDSSGCQGEMEGSHTFDPQYYMLLCQQHPGLGAEGNIRPHEDPVQRYSDQIGPPSDRE